MKHIVIVGGGLAGLINAIQLKQPNIQVTVIEKQQYPFHRVCGEYISNETLPFLQQLGFNPFAHGAVPLSQFLLSSPKGTILQMPLDLGGFGISRYELDKQLYELAQKKGVIFYLKTQVQKITPNAHSFQIDTGSAILQADLVIGAFGKLSNLDGQLARKSFFKKSPYIGVKYHIQLPDTTFHPQNLIALHNFEEGYCGISRVENDTYCLCYLTTRRNLKKHKTLPDLEKTVLQKNPYLKHIFTNAYFLWEKPKVINEVSFAAKKSIEQNILMCGDSAGMITPLCGNGMAMAIHSAKLLSELVLRWEAGDITQQELHQQYQKTWKKHFATRLWVGRWVQHFFGNALLTEILVRSFKKSKFLAQWLVKQTHGKVF